MVDTELHKEECQGSLVIEGVAAEKEHKIDGVKDGKGAKKKRVTVMMADRLPEIINPYDTVLSRLLGQAKAEKIWQVCFKLQPLLAIPWVLGGVAFVAGSNTLVYISCSFHFFQNSLSALLPPSLELVGK